MAVRFAKACDLARVNVLRKQDNDLHAAGKPVGFRTYRRYMEL